ncbi:alpha/beta hydrolase [Saccharibacillus sp. CPCC 101409]|uniref:alpha/beta fold hydrolase n=1 Tax=Saccharibacillus sp. CPCC 101409 TaxID=3058041 RepID=UPI00267408D1|nr:alpha/beta hydrolase [Saccharibacillus sp. CPCC 101409]MDO3410387.1 alpha/beta hydrolase [Saccharibacillus sp. CPCC 101409]
MTIDILKRNHVKVLGSGERTIVFGHGFGCDQEMWRLVAPRFADRYRVVLFDYVGAGRSSLDQYDSVKYGDLEGYAQDLLDVMQSLKLKNAVYVGHSISGMIGALASIRRPESFSRMVMVGSSPRYLNDSPGYYGGFDPEDIEELLEMMQLNFIGWASHVAAFTMKNPERAELKEELERQFASRDPQIARQFAEVTFYCDCRSILPDVPVPVLILQCSDDSIAPLEVGDYLHARLRRSTLKHMTAKGHYPQLSQPDETFRLIDHYVTGM